MRVSLFLLMSIIAVSCAEETELYNAPVARTAQFDETDFNFLLRAIHPAQQVELVMDDGSSEIFRFHGNIKVFRNGRVTGKAFLQSVRLGWRYLPSSAVINCLEGRLVVTLRATVQRVNKNQTIDPEDVVVINIETRDNETDSPDCVIWDIMTGGGDSPDGVFDPYGNIFIANSDCR